MSYRICGVQPSSLEPVYSEAFVINVLSSLAAVPRPRAALVHRGLPASPAAALIRTVRLLFIENADSFTWNVIESLPWDRSAVILCTGAELGRRASLLDGVDAVVLGPGPTDPLRAGLVPIVHAVVRARLPLLGICLGHQALALAFGARLARSEPTHGKQSTCWFRPSRFFAPLVGPQRVMRYHSLVVEDVSKPLRVVAATRDGIPMAIEHESLPLAGLQFHPDSYATPRGREMIASFFETVLPVPLELDSPAATTRWAP